jgi:hypothetical protein
VGFLVYKVAMGQVFSEYFGFPCQFAAHRLLHNHHHLSSGAGTIDQTVAAESSGISLTPLTTTTTMMIIIISIPGKPGGTEVKWDTSDVGFC